MTIHYVHRGLVKKGLKENTLSAFRQSFLKKYGVETDLHFTKDNKIVCFHDFNLKAKFKLNKKIRDTNYFEIKKISTKYKTKVPLLSELLNITKNNYSLMLELKPVLTDKNLYILLKILKKKNKFKLISFREVNLKKLYKLNNKLHLGLLLSASKKINYIKKKIKKNYIKFIVLNRQFLGNQKLNAIKKPIYYYTIKNKKDFKKYKGYKNLIFENL